MASVSTIAQQTFRSGVELVELNVIVLDRDRRPVRGLTQQDFTILEDGKSRPIVAFAAVDLEPPGSAGSATTPSANVVTNDRSDEGRLVVIVFDRSIPAGPSTEAAKTIARAAVDALGQHDLGAVVRTSGFANEGKSQNFTRDRTLLLEAVDSHFTGLVSPPSMGGGRGGGLAASPPEMFMSGDCLCGLCSLESLERIAEALTAVRGHQKIVLFIGSDIVIDDARVPPFCAGRIKPAREATLRALDRANVTVHSIDPVGLEALTAGVGPVESSFGAVRQRIQARQGNLEVLPSYTGGRFVRNTNAPSEIIPQIFTETASYYLLGFERSGTLRDSTQRPMKVRISRPGVTVVARKAYFPVVARSKPADATPLSGTITGVMPVPDIPMAMSLVSVFTASGEVKTHAVIGVKKAALDVSAGATTGAAAEVNTPDRFDLVLGVFDDRAKTVLTTSNTLQIEPDSCGAEWCETISQLELKPGRYEIRVGVRVHASAKEGSVYGYIQVPALRTDTFLVSDLQIGAETSGVAVPSVRRTFRPDERLAIFTQVRRPLDPPAPVTVRVAIANSQSTVVAQSSSTLEGSSFSASGISDVKVDQPLSRLSSGTYVLTIEAEHLGRLTRRGVSFDIR